MNPVLIDVEDGYEAVRVIIRENSLEVENVEKPS